MSNDTSQLIAHVVFRFAVGGLENGLVNLVNRLPQSDWRHVVVSLTDIDETFARRVQRDDVRYVALGKRPGHAVRLYPALYALFRELVPAIVHTRNLAALECLAPAWAAQVPVRVHGEHGRDMRDPEGALARYQWVRRVYRPFVTKYVALSPDLASYLHDKVGVPRARIEQIYNGVDTEKFQPPATKPMAALGCPFDLQSSWVVGTVGRLDAVKDQVNLARAFIHLLRLHPGARDRLRLVIVGDGELRTEIEALLHGAKARELAWLCGSREDIVPLMQAFDCFVLPSIAEGVSNTILEAMATGLPVVATRVGANAELVEEGVTGQLVPARNSVALANAIGTYLHDPVLARRHGRAGRQRVAQRFSLDRMVERYQRLYTELLQRAPGKHASTDPALGRSRRA